MRSPVVTLTCALLTCSPAVAQKMQLEEADRRAEAIIADATPETTLAVNQLSMPEGIEATLWAHEPMLANPVAFDFDEQGRAFVSETYRYRTSVLDIRGYMDMLEEDMAFRTVDDRAQGIVDLFGEQAADFEIESERIRFLEDRDGDGVADFSAAYAEDFDSSLSGIASGVLARQGEIYFTNIPHLWKLEGLTDEGKAESRQSIQRGYGVHFGYTGHDFHGLAIGPDGKLYYSIGDRGAHLETKDGRTVSVPDQGAVYRSNFDGTELELVHSGLRNPQELAFDEYGNLFTGENDMDAGDFERLVQIAEGGDSGWRIGHQHPTPGRDSAWMAEGWWKTRFDGQAKFILPPISYIDDGPSGIAYYPGTGLAPGYQGHLFITHFKGTIATSGVTSYTMEPDGASFRLDEKKDFLNGVLPTDVDFAPDGRFYVLDWVDGWPKSAKGRIYALANPETLESEIVKQTESLIAEGMTNRSRKELVELLAHPNWNVRLEAQLELADRGPSSRKALAKLANDADAHQLARLHATWALGILADRGDKKAPAEISKLARAEDPEVRAQAAKLIGDHGIAADFELLVSYLEDDSARVRYFAAQSLGKLGNPDAAPALIEAARANDGEDAYLAHAIVMGLAGANNLTVLANHVTDDSTAVRYAVLLTYRRLGDVNAARFLHDADKHVVFEAARAINDAPIARAYPALAKAVDSPFADDPILADRAINALFRIGGPEQAETMARVAAEPDRPEAIRIEAITQLANWPDPLQRDRIVGVYRPLEARPAEPAAEALANVAHDIFANGSGAVQAEFIAAIETLDIPGMEDELYALVLDESKDGAARVAAYNALNEMGDPRLDELVLAASQSSSSELRLATLPTVAQRSPEEAKATLSLMVEGSVEERRAAYQTLAETDAPFAAALLVDSLESLAEKEVPHAAQLELIEATEDHPNPQVQQAFAAYQAVVAADPDPLAPYSYALEGGRNWPGRQVFYYNTTMACVRCHIVDGPGDAAGPNFSDIGLRLDRRELLEGIVLPSATMAKGFENVILTLKDGSSKFGVVESETEEAIVLKTPTGAMETVAKADVANRNAVPSSMPAIFGHMLEREDIRDLVEYLANRTQDPNARVTHGE